MKATKPAWIDADAAVALLGVSRATLYAYVSRGRIRSEAAPGSTRKRRYARDDVERLRSRTQERRNPEKAAEQALHWGLPILESGITLIADGRLYYRGRDAIELARTKSLEEVAALLWTGKPDAALFDSSTRSATPKDVVSAVASRATDPFVARAQAALALTAAHDALAYDLRPRAVASTGWRLLQLLARVAAGRSAADSTIDRTLAEAWQVPRSTDLIRAALIL